MRLFILSFAFLATTCFSYICEGQSLVTDSTIKVGIKETPPFIIKETEGYKGVSIALWESIASELNIQYKYEEYDLPGLLDALEKGSIDVCINPLTVTSERARKFDFTQPFYITNLAIATSKADKGKVAQFIENFFSVNFFKAVLLLFLVILMFGLLVWVFERKQNREEFDKGAAGVWSGIWWSAVTMTTVGYGDKSPKTTGGRIVALIWMFTAIIIISGFTASIASALTVNQLDVGIEGINDLKKIKTAVIKGSSSELYLRQNGIPYLPYDSPEEALHAIANEEIQAFVYDEPILRYLIQNQKVEESVMVLPYKINTQYYSFSVPDGSPLLEDLEITLLENIREVEWKGVLNEYNLLE